MGMGWGWGWGWSKGWGWSSLLLLLPGRTGGPTYMTHHKQNNPTQEPHKSYTRATQEPHKSYTRATWEIPTSQGKSRGGALEAVLASLAPTVVQAEQKDEVGGGDALGLQLLVAAYGERGAVHKLRGTTKREGERGREEDRKEERKEVRESE